MTNFLQQMPQTNHNILSPLNKPGAQNLSFIKKTLFTLIYYAAKSFAKWFLIRSLQQFHLSNLLAK